MRAFALCSLVLAVSACKIDDPFDTLTSITGLLTDSTTGDVTASGTTGGESSGDVTASGTSGDVPTTSASDSTTTTPGSTSEPGTTTTASGSTGEPGSTGGGSTGGGDADPWNPDTCAMPNQVLMVGIVDGNFCSTPCMNDDADCPAGPMGTQGLCILTTMMGSDPSFCALICQTGMDTCPEGATCKDLKDPMNPGAGLCTYP